MSIIEHITLSEFQNLWNSLQLPSETRFSIQFEDNQIVQQVLKEYKSLEAMKKLRGSGNGNLVNALLAERENEVTS